MKKIGIVAAAVAAGAVALYLLATPRGSAPREAGESASASAPEFEAAPPLSARTVDGKTVSLAGLKGKVVLVDFWATWCDPCREEIPELVKMQMRLKDKGFTFLGVSMDEEGAKAVKRFTAKQPIDYPVILNDGERAPKGWVVPGLPTAYLIGRDGTVRKRWFGEKNMTELEDAIDAVLAK